EREKIAVLMPIRLPAASTSAPPELPGLIAASVWMKFSKVLMPRPVRPRAETMPLVTVCPTPNGLPMASTTSPTRSASEEPKRIVEQRMARRGDFLGGEDVHDRRRCALYRVVIGRRRGARARGERRRRCAARLRDRYSKLRARARGQPFRAEGRHDEQRRYRDRRGLRKNEPEAVHARTRHYTEFLLRFRCLRAKS